jgi:ribonuclease Z
MARLVVLGSASIIPDAEHENTHMIIQGDTSSVLIDCVGTPLVRLGEAGVGIEDIDHVVLTHFHPDHVGAFPELLITQWLLGRKSAMTVHGLTHCLERIEQLMTAYHWEDWAGLFPVTFHYLPEEEGCLVLDNDEFQITASPVRHFVPTIGVRVLVKESGFIFAYSSDTTPCPEVVRLSHNADLLIHEATGVEPLGHSNSSQAGAIAEEACAKRLGLIHYPVLDTTPPVLLEGARKTFSGPVFVCEDLMEIELNKNDSGRG